MIDIDKLEELYATSTWSQQYPWRNGKKVKANIYWNEDGGDDARIGMMLKPADAILAVAAVNALPELVAELRRLYAMEADSKPRAPNPRDSIRKANIRSEEKIIPPTAWPFQSDKDQKP